MFEVKIMKKDFSQLSLSQESVSKEQVQFVFSGASGKLKKFKLILFLQKNNFLGSRRFVKSYAKRSSYLHQKTEKLVRVEILLKVKLSKVYWKCENAQLIFFADTISDIRWIIFFSILNNLQTFTLHFTESLIPIKLIA